MAAELLGAKMLAPYFGSSLYVWSTVLAITLGGLAIGYYVGGIISEKKNPERNLYYILLLSASFLILMPVMAKTVMVHTAGFSLLPSVVVSAFLFLFPPVFFMGMVSPVIVRCVTSFPTPHPKEKEEDGRAGKVAGTVYAISTFGGILSTFFLGFYLIPDFGLTKPAIAAGIILGIIPFFKLIAKNKLFLLFFPLVILVLAGGSFITSSLFPTDSDVKILYSSEGLLGQVIVADYPLYKEVEQAKGFRRILFVNRSMQTLVINRNGERTYFDYVGLISKKVKHPSQSSSALVLGLGGGTVANEFFKKGFQVDAVELDSRMVHAAKTYFGLNEKVNIHIDDARHFIKYQVSSIRPADGPGKYQVIVLDAFVGEVNPHHLFTQEFFSELKSLLAEDGLFFINGNGFWNGKAGKGMRSICKTLMNAGFDIEIVPTSNQEEYSNLVFISKKSPHPSLMLGQGMMPDLDDAIILTDEKPQLEILNAEANKRWREGCMKSFLSEWHSNRNALLFK